MDRLTTNADTNSNYLQMMNFAYYKDGKVYLKYADGEDDIDLCEYVSRMAKDKNCCPSAEEVMEGACAECDCELAVLYIAAVQAAELRDHLMAYEDTGWTPEEIMKLKGEKMIKNYNPNIDNATHTVRITLMQWDYVGHISRLVGGNCKGAGLLNADCFEYDTQENIDRYVENDCKLSYNEDYDIFEAVLTNPKGEKIEIERDRREMKNMVVGIEFVEVKEK